MDVMYWNNPQNTEGYASFFFLVKDNVGLFSSVGGFVVAVEFFGAWASFGAT